MKITRPSGSKRTRMSQSEVRKFDLNIEKILEGWEAAPRYPGSACQCHGRASVDFQ